MVGGAEGAHSRVRVREQQVREGGSRGGLLGTEGRTLSEQKDRDRFLRGRTMGKMDG